MANDADTVETDDQPTKGARKLYVPEIYQTADGFWSIDGHGDAKYTKEDAKRVAQNLAIAKRAKNA